MSMAAKEIVGALWEVNWLFNLTKKLSTHTPNDNYIYKNENQ